MGCIATAKPFRVPPPLDLEVAFHNAAMADAAELVPDTARLDGVRCGYRTDDPARMLRVLIAWTHLAASTIPAGG